MQMYVFQSQGFIFMPPSISDGSVCLSAHHEIHTLSFALQYTTAKKFGVSTIFCEVAFI